MTDGSDPDFPDAHDERDIIIPVMGATGVGKSTFINWIAREDKAKVGMTMESETKTLEAISIDVEDLTLPTGKRLILLDTPGFDDTNGHEALILRRIAVWLAKSYKNERHLLGGIIHLHDIRQTKMNSSLKRSLDVFSCLCGDSAYPRIALGTTKWPPSDTESPQATGAATTYGSLRNQAQTRFSQLENGYWKDLIGSGSKTYRIENRESCVQLVRSILENLLTTEGGKVELQIQKEVVDEGKAVPKTKAGMVFDMLDREGRKNRQASAIKEERGGEKVIQQQLKEMKRQLAKLPSNKNKSLRPFRFLKSRKKPQNVGPPADLSTSSQAISLKAPSENAAEALTCSHD